MEKKMEIGPSQYPSVELAYEYVRPSYEIMVNRFEAANSRIQNVLTWAIGITAAIPLFSKAILGDIAFESIWFVLALLAFSGVIIVGILAQRMGVLTLIDPKILYAKHLHYSEWEFKKNMVFWSGDHFKTNRKSIEAKSRYVDIMTILFALEVAFAFVGVLRT